VSKRFSLVEIGVYGKGKTQTFDCNAQSGTQIAAHANLRLDDVVPELEGENRQRRRQKQGQQQKQIPSG